MEIIVQIYLKKLIKLKIILKIYRKNQLNLVKLEYL